MNNEFGKERPPIDAERELEDSRAVLKSILDQLPVVKEEIVVACQLAADFKQRISEAEALEAANIANILESVDKIIEQLGKVSGKANELYESGHKFGRTLKSFETTLLIQHHLENDFASLTAPLVTARSIWKSIKGAASKNLETAGSELAGNIEKACSETEYALAATDNFFYLVAGYSIFKN